MKGTAKAAQKSVKTAKTAINDIQQAANVERKTAQATVKASQKAAEQPLVCIWQSNSDGRL
ncbi:MAG: hypothetical protein EGR80_11905 [Ruminiclostridium sp.]|nr:hypothetical protein [Ruminiclostridium sp.]